MSEITTAVLHHVLDALEAEENALLVWGDTGGFFSEEELLTHIRRELGVVFKRTPTDEECDITQLAMLDAAMLIRCRTSVVRLSGEPEWGDGPSHAQPAPVDA